MPSGRGGEIFLFTWVIQLFFQITSFINIMPIGAFIGRWCSKGRAKLFSPPGYFLCLPDFTDGQSLSHSILSVVSSVSVSVYYVTVRTIVPSRHGSSLARPVIIHDIIHGLIYVPSTPYCGFFGVSPDGNCAYVH